MYNHATATLNKGINFSAFRTVVLSPTQINTIVTDFSSYASGKGMKVKYVDPYTYYNLLKSSGQGENLGTATTPSTSSTPQAVTPRPVNNLVNFDQVNGFSGRFNTSLAIETTNKREGSGALWMGFDAPTAQASSTQIGGMVNYQFTAPVDLSAAESFTLDYWLTDAIVGSAALQINFVTNGVDDGFNFLVLIDNASSGWHTIRLNKYAVTSTVDNADWSSISAIRITYYNYANNTKPTFMMLDNLTVDANVTVPTKQTVIASFDSVTNFTGAYNTSLAIETNEKKEGNGSMRAGFNAPTAQSGSTKIGGMVFHTFSSALDLSDARAFTLDYYVPETITGSAGLQVNFVTNGADDGYNFLVAINGATAGWNRLTLNPGNPTAAANSPDWSSIKGIRITYFNYDNNTTLNFMLFDNLIKVS